MGVSCFNGGGGFILSGGECPMRGGHRFWWEGGVERNPKMGRRVPHMSPALWETLIEVILLCNVGPQRSG